MPRRAAAADVALTCAVATGHERVTDAEQVGRGERWYIPSTFGQPPKPDIRIDSRRWVQTPGIGLAAAVVVGAGVYGRELLISRDAVRTQVIGEIRAVTGLAPMLRGDATVRCFRAAA